MPVDSTDHNDDDSPPISVDEAVEHCDCKVGQSAWSYGIIEEVANVGNRWATSPEGAGISSKTLARTFNRHIIESACEDAEMRLLDGEAENYRRILRGEPGVDSGDQVDAKSKLDAEGVDVEALEGAMIAETTMHQHLTNCLGLEYERPEPVPEASVEDIRQAQKNARENVERAIRQQGLDAQVARIGVTTTVTCAACERVLDADSFILDGGCDCTES